jgi:hypothetical protein
MRLEPITYYGLFEDNATRRAYMYQRFRGRMIVRWYRTTTGKVIIFGVY